MTNDIEYLHVLKVYSYIIFCEVYAQIFCTITGFYWDACFVIIEVGFCNTQGYVY